MLASIHTYHRSFCVHGLRQYQVIRR